MAEYTLRRTKLFQKMKENSCALIFAGAPKLANEDAYLPYVINKNFYYLTGIEQEGSVLLLVKSLGEEKTYLFIDEYNEVKEKWTGKRLTAVEASEISSINNVNFKNTLDSYLSLVLANENNQYGNIDTLYLDLSPEILIQETVTTRDLSNSIKKKMPHINVENIKPILTRLRMIKSDEEVEEIRKAIVLTANGINHLIVNIKPGIYEYSLADKFEFYGRENNRSQLSFPTIIAGGRNSTILHYPSQNDQLNNGDVVLFDLGYACNYYCADISRTYPVNGTFTDKQKKIYEAVLHCNKALIEYARAGLTIKDLQEYATNFLRNECLRLKLIKEDEDIRKYYYHGCSHHLGLDTHDCSDRELPLEPGNVITIEPGLYFIEDGIGVRIEDDILITENRSENLSKDIIKNIEDIEKLFKLKA